VNGGPLAKIGKTQLSKTDKKLLKSLGQRVGAIRERRELSVYDLTGDDMPIRSRQHWQQIEAGQKNVNITTVFKLAQSLGVRIEDLVRGLGSEE
jgi:transcriptional regulator with XRE-family HTH domain